MTESVAIIAAILVACAALIVMGVLLWRSRRPGPAL